MRISSSPKCTKPIRVHMTQIACSGATLLPVLSAQFMTAPTGRPGEMRNLAPAEPPRPEKQLMRVLDQVQELGENNERFMCGYGCTCCSRSCDRVLNNFQRGSNVLRRALA